MALADERVHKANDASKRMAEAHAEFNHATREVVRAYRRCMRLSAENQQIPGAATKLPRDFSFHSFTNEMYPTFTTAEIMRQGRIYDFEKE